MGTLFVVLAVIGLLGLIGGGTWALIAQGRTTRREGADVGAEIMAGNEFGSAPDAGSVFVGRGAAVKREVDVPIASLKDQWLAGRRREVLPFVIAMAGFEAMLIFGGLALLVGVDEKIWGLFLLAAGLYTAWLLFKELRSKRPQAG